MVFEQTLQIATLLLLENPGIFENEPAKTQQQGGTGKEETLGPFQNSRERSSLNQDSHLAAARLPVEGDPAGI
jgi:hypothetical protein